MEAPKIPVFTAEDGKNCLDVSIVNPVLKATMHIFNTMVGQPVQPGKPFITEGNSPLVVDVSAVIGFRGKSVLGSVVLCFSEQVFLSVMTSMLGEDIEEIDDEVRDGACELLNMIYGLARTEWNKTNSFGLDITLPSLVTDEDLRIESLTPQPPLILPFNCECGLFYMYMGMLKLKGSKDPDKPFCITEVKRRYI